MSLHDMIQAAEARRKPASAKPAKPEKLERIRTR